MDAIKISIKNNLKTLQEFEINREVRSVELTDTEMMNVLCYVNEQVQFFSDWTAILIAWWSLQHKSYSGAKFQTAGSHGFVIALVLIFKEKYELSAQVLNSGN